MKVKIEGKDIVASVAIAGSCLLIYMGHDGGIVTIFSTIVGYYFGYKSAKGD